MSKHIIDPDKLAKALGIPWEHPQLEICETGEVEEVFENVYRFHLQESERPPALTLLLREDDPYTIEVRVEMKNGYESLMTFGNIARVSYIRRYKTVEIESLSNGTLKIYSRGQFDLNI